MKLKSLSASSALNFEGCEARWKAEYGSRAHQPSGSPAALGTACHTALEEWVKQGHHLDPSTDASVMTALWDAAYWEGFQDAERYDEGLAMVQNWRERTEFSGRTVISTEQRMSFPIKTSIGEIPFNYIWDREDRWDDGTIEIIDYKSWMAPLRPDTMRTKIQVRSYALAGAIKYPDAPRIWVTLDQLRHEQVSTSFSRDENVETWKYLKALAERIIASDGTKESLNIDCRYCIRRHACTEMVKHESVDGFLGLDDPFEAANRRYRLDAARKAMEAMIEELDSVVLGHCEREDVTEFQTGYVDVAITAYGKRVIDPAVAAKILGPLAAEFPGGLGIGVIDKLMKEKPPRLSAEQSSALKQAIRREYGDARVKAVAADPTA